MIKILFYLFCFNWFIACSNKTTETIPKQGVTVAYIESPSAQAAGFIGWKGNIVILDCIKGNKRYLTEKPAHFSRPRWSPDGTQLAYVSDGMFSWERPFHHSIYLFDFQSGHSTVLWQQLERKHVRYFALNQKIEWSPNGKSILFPFFNYVYEAALDESYFRPLLKLDTLNYISEIWRSPDGLSLAVLTSLNTMSYVLSILHISDSTVTKIFEDSFFINPIQWIAGSDSLMFTAKNQIFIYDCQRRSIHTFKSSILPRDAEIGFLTKTLIVGLGNPDSTDLNKRDVFLYNMNTDSLSWLTNDGYYKTDLAVSSSR